MEKLTQLGVYPTPQPSPNQPVHKPNPHNKSCFGVKKVGYLCVSVYLFMPAITDRQKSYQILSHALKSPVVILQPGCETSVIRPPF